MQEMKKKENKLDKRCMEEDFDILHLITEAYHTDVLGLDKWTEKDTREFLETNEKLFWSWYSCIVETKLKYKINKERDAEDEKNRS